MGSREDVLDRWNLALKNHQVNILYNSEVKSVSGTKGKFELTLKNKDIIKAESIVLAIGLQGNLNTLRIPGIDDVSDEPSFHLRDRKAAARRRSGIQPSDTCFQSLFAPACA